MPRYDAVLFDFDGTIADTSRGIKNAIRYSLDQKQIPVGNPDELDYFIGPPLYNGYHHVYKTEEPLTSELVDLYRVYYGKQGVFELDLYPNIKETLSFLKEAGVKTAITSSKPLHFLEQAVSFVGVDGYFDAVVGPELKNKEANKTYLIQKAMSVLGVSKVDQVCVVGDRFFDIEGGKSAGIKAIGVTYGFGTEEELRSAGADFLAHSAKELKDFLL